jgi:hypothetical protein
MPTVYQLKCDIRKIDPTAKITMKKAGLEAVLRRLKAKGNLQTAPPNRFGTEVIDNGKRQYTSI